MINKKCVPCQGGIPPLKEKEINLYLKKINNKWLVENNIKILREFSFELYSQAIEFSNKVAKLAEQEDHHPHIHINFKKVIIYLFTHKINGLHDNDFIMAAKIDKIFEK